jgi:hypothetical protein
MFDTSLDEWDTLWLQLLLPYTVVKNFYLEKEFTPDIATALQEPVGGNNRSAAQPAEYFC